MTQIRVPITGVVGPAGPQGPAGANGAGSFTGGDIPNPIKAWRGTGGLSTRALDTPVVKVVDTTGVGFRTFQVFGDEAIAQIGPTPSAVQWTSGASGAPAGSGGPVNRISTQAGLYVINGPVGGDAVRVMIANADLSGASATGGPNQDSLGMSGAATGRIRMNLESASADGGWRFLSNTYAGIAPAAAGETATLNGTNVTFSADVSAKIGVGDAFYLYLIPSPYTGAGEAYNTPPGSPYGTGGFAQTKLAGFTLITQPTGLTGTFTSFQEIGASMNNTVNNYALGGNPADFSKGQIKWGTDSSSDFFGWQYAQPRNSTHAQANNFGDYNVLLYPGGIIGRPDSGTDRGGFMTSADLVVKQPGRGFRIGISGTDTNGNYKASVFFAPHYPSDNAGTTEFYGQLRAKGGANNSRAAFYIQSQVSNGTNTPGDIWTNGTNIYWINDAGVTKTITIT